MANPVHQFEVHSLTEDSIEFMGYDLSFTNSALWMVLSALTAIILLTLSTRGSKMVPTRAQMAAELMYDFVSSMVNENTAGKGRQYFPFVFTLFIFILAGNVLGLIPGSFTFTSHLIVTVFLAVLIFVMSIGFGLYNHGLKFFSMFMPAGVPIFLVPVIIPIELISFFVRPLTHSVRLFANMMAGHLILKIVAGFSVGAITAGGFVSLLSVFPVLANVAMLSLELLVAGVQAYVFAILACVYLKDSVDLHH